MDAAIADTINRRDAQVIAAHLDTLDLDWSNAGPWHDAPFADMLLGTQLSGNAERAWIFGFLAAGTRNVAREVAFDGAPADCDWENLFSHIRAEILARRDPKSHPVRAAEIPVLDGVGSQ